jgi:hypothetical protein
MRKLGSCTFDVALVVAILAVPVIAIVEATAGHPWLLLLMGVGFTLQGWRAKLGGRFVQ